MDKRQIALGTCHQTGVWLGPVHMEKLEKVPLSEVVARLGRPELKAKDFMERTKAIQFFREKWGFPSEAYWIRLAHKAKILEVKAKPEDDPSGKNQRRSYAHVPASIREEDDPEVVWAWLRGKRRNAA